MDQFLIGPGAALAHDAVPVFAVAHGLAVVRGDDHHRLFPEALLADRIEQVADPFVHEFHFFHVQRADMGALLFRHHALDLGPRSQDHRIALIVRVMRARFPFPDGRRIPRFVGIERVHPHQERPLRIAFAPQPVVGFPGDDADIVVGVRLPELTLLEVALGFPDQGLRRTVVFAVLVPVQHAGRQIVLSLHGGVQRHVMERLVVQLMPVAELYIVEPARIAVLGQAHGRCIIHQRRLHFPAPQHVGQAGVVQIQRLPPGVGQSEAPGHDRPADGNGGEALAIGVLEQEPLSGKAIQIGRFDLRIAVAPQIVELERVQHNENHILDRRHVVLSRLFWSREPACRSNARCRSRSGRTGWRKWGRTSSGMHTARNRTR